MSSLKFEVGSKIEYRDDDGKIHECIVEKIENESKICVKFNDGKDKVFTIEL